MPEKKRIMIVDDQNYACDTLSLTLNHLGYDDIVTAKSGEEALNILEESSFDLIFSEIKMLGMSGIDLLQKIKKSSPNVIFIICTAYADVDSFFEAMSHGAFEYLSKPITTQKIKKTIDKILKKLIKRKKPKTALEKKIADRIKANEHKRKAVPIIKA